MTTDNNSKQVTTIDPIDAIIQAWDEGLKVGAEDSAFGYAMLPDIEQARHTRLHKWLRLNSAVSPAEMQKAVTMKIRRAKIEAELGGVPETASELVRLIVVRDKIECSYDGAIKQSLQPYIIDSKGEKIIATEADMEIQLVRLHVHFYFPKSINLQDLKLRLRLANSNLGLRFYASDIEDAVEGWYTTAKAERLHDLYISIAGDVLITKDRQKADVTWQGIADKIFDCSERGTEYTIAVLQSFMWQIKRKILGLPVTNHIMPVILGPQGVGKTTFVTNLISPIRELSIETSFDAIEDERNIEIWDRYVLFLDEMGHANRSDVDAIKHAITAAKLSRRPMRSNGQISVDQKATFIGCSNKVLAQLIKDATGMRRFVSAQFSNNPDWAYQSGIDWFLLWRSVDEYGDNPIVAHLEEMRSVQEDERHLGRVESWIKDFDPTHAYTSSGTSYKSLLNVRDRISKDDLYEIFRVYEERVNPGSIKTSLNDWTHEMKRLEKDSTKGFVFQKQREANGVHYKYVGTIITNDQSFVPRVV